RRHRIRALTSCVDLALRRVWPPVGVASVTSVCGSVDAPEKRLLLRQRHTKPEAKNRSWNSLLKIASIRCWSSGHKWASAGRRTRDVVERYFAGASPRGPPSECPYPPPQ